MHSLNEVEERVCIANPLKRARATHILSLSNCARKRIILEISINPTNSNLALVNGTLVRIGYITYAKNAA